MAVASPHGPSARLAELTGIARSYPSTSAFRSAIIDSGQFSQQLTRLLTDVDGLIEAALGRLDRDASGFGGNHELGWRLLRSLFVIQLQIEGDVAADRTRMVSELQVLTGSPELADRLRLRLVELAARYDVRAGRVTRSMLRRELRSFDRLGPSADHRHGRDKLELLEALLRQLTRGSLPSAFTIDRSRQRAELVSMVSTADADRSSSYAVSRTLASQR